MKSEIVPVNQKPQVKPQKIWDRQCTYLDSRTVKGKMKYKQCKMLTGPNYFFCPYHLKVVS